MNHFKDGFDYLIKHCNDQLEKYMIKTEPFDLEKALAGAELITRVGNKIVEWHYFKSINEIFAKCNEEGMGRYDRFGKHMIHNDRDLFIVSKQEKIPFNLERALAGDTVIDEYDNVQNEFKAFIGASPHGIVYISHNGNLSCCDKDGNNKFIGVQLYMAENTNFKKRYWVNICRTPSGTLFAEANLFNSVEQANKLSQFKNDFVIRREIIF